MFRTRNLFRRERHYILLDHEAPFDFCNQVLAILFFCGRIKTKIAIEISVLSH